uniref:NADH dehydrogenase subunit 4L n=1 Tax=Walchia hayashii TaxID=436352 RepID=B3IUL9_9ACAR|nr:NADH dehydrogenase subunit 4L [Walchia hayashii]BAG24173.1 NADH dehydrogenase subunit 4L [Walchia hayashii]
MSSGLFFLKLIFSYSVFMFMILSTHFLMALLFLEIMSMVLYFSVLLSSGVGDGSVMILFLCVMVLEGAFGLSLVVSGSRKSGGDFLIFF